MKLRWLVLECAAVAWLLYGCAHSKPQRDTPVFHACRMSCENDGAAVDFVLETDHDIACVCKKPPESGT